MLFMFFFYGNLQNIIPDSPPFLSYLEESKTNEWAAGISWILALLRDCLTHSDCTSIIQWFHPHQIILQTGSFPKPGNQAGYQMFLRISIGFNYKNKLFDWTLFQLNMLVIMDSFLHRHMSLHSISVLLSNRLMFFYIHMRTGSVTTK